MRPNGSVGSFATARKVVRQTELLLWGQVCLFCCSFVIFFCVVI